ncbi:LOW QUALITY PROTEIN: hypothetical protein V1477_014129 [Vespula maculifrons]|uniref:Uncharacterized protein n=1 Tax=Vespula maculifrons TaxID=7453 RepID=A0ABD2BK75_VESMC
MKNNKKYNINNTIWMTNTSNNYIIYNRIAQETKREVCLAVVAVDPSNDEHLDLGDEERYTNTDSNSILLIFPEVLIALEEEKAATKKRFI